MLGWIALKQLEFQTSLQKKALFHKKNKKF